MKSKNIKLLITLILLLSGLQNASAQNQSGWQKFRSTFDLPVKFKLRRVKGL